MDLRVQGEPFHERCRLETLALTLSQQVDIRYQAALVPRDYTVFTFKPYFARDDQLYAWYYLHQNDSLILPRATVNDILVKSIKYAVRRTDNYFLADDVKVLFSATKGAITYNISDRIKVIASSDGPSGIFADVPYQDEIRAPVFAINSANPRFGTLLVDTYRRMVVPLENRHRGYRDDISKAEQNATAESWKKQLNQNH